MGNPPPPAGPDARAQLSTPAILLIVAAGLSIAYGLFSVVTTALTSGSPDFMLKFINDAALRDQIREAMKQSDKNSALNYGWPMIIVLANAFVVFGAVQMKSLRAYPLALSAAIISAIPCLFTGCCCITSMPVGIWAIVLLVRPEVKSQFT